MSLAPHAWLFFKLFILKQTKNEVYFASLDNITKVGFMPFLQPEPYTIIVNEVLMKCNPLFCVFGLYQKLLVMEGV